MYVLISNCIKKAYSLNIMTAFTSAVLVVGSYIVYIIMKSFCERVI